ncbi:hypothetical protein [Nocardia beijingensis]|uniref:hypothetical protein n=1 Tax=Nocardia beijingensis TaxID=95162 RepID=UPI000A83BC4B|nr:hypothetical protein [Nocardia beijingensis]
MSSALLPASDQNTVRSPIRRRDTDDCHGVLWVRTLLEQYRLLETSRSIDGESRSVIVFAIHWAPFGGATTEELFVNFGVARPRFV